jgi:hypothetical protein
MIEAAAPLALIGPLPMQRMILALLLLAVPLTGAQAGVDPIEANDTGGIIAWSPEAQRHARSIAREHCAQYGKLARITSVYARYGQYIGFACRLPRGRSGVILRTRY